MARDRLHGVPGEFPIVRCLTCGLMRTSPRPTPDTIGAYYPDDYSCWGPPPPPRPPWRRRLRDLVGRAIESNATRLPPVEPGRLLEIGCGTGHFLRAMAERGWQARGLDAAPRAVAICQAAGLEVAQGLVGEIAPPAEPFDLVVGWMVLEHLHDPLEVLQILRGWVRPNGWIALSVPNAGSALFRLFGADWYELHIPAHLYHFTPATLRALLERAGWTPRRFLFHRVLHGTLLSAVLASGASEELERFRAAQRALNRFPNLTRAALQPLALATAWAGQASRMTVWAQATRCSG